MKIRHRHQSATPSFTDPSILGDNDLLDLLFTEEDRLPRSVVDEITRRGERLRDNLTAIIRDEANWRGCDHEQWAVRHAVFILGAFASAEDLPTLILASRYADKYDDDWIGDSLDAIFGSIGMPMLGPLRAIAADKSNPWYVRNTAMDGLASIVMKHPEEERAVFDLMAQLLTDETEDREIRGAAGNILLDFKQISYHKNLLAYAHEEDHLADEDPLYDGWFDEDDVREMMSSEATRHLRQYTKDWLRFYDPSEIEQRQRHWREARQWWRAPQRWFRWLQIRRELRLFIKEAKQRSQVQDANFNNHQ